MYPVQDSHYTIVLVELVMMEVMCLWGGEEGEMVATVVDGCASDGQGVPEPRGGEVGSQEEWASHNGAKVDDNVLNGMGVHRSDSDRRDPFVVSFMDVLVEIGVMHESV